MITDQLISITELRQNASQIIEKLKNADKIVIIHNKPKAALIDIEEYERYKKLSKYEEAIENMLFLANNPSLNFLKNEPDLYEDV